MGYILKYGLAIILTIGALSIKAQNLSDLDKYEVDEMYKKVSVEDGSLDEDGRPIDFILEPTTMSSGTYQIEITDGPGNLYKVRDSNLYLKLRGHYGVASYRDKCILKVEGRYSRPILYKLD
jgi:hypothetical protein